MPSNPIKLLIDMNSTLNWTCRLLPMIAWIAVGVAPGPVVMAQYAGEHVNSISGNGTSHSISKNWHGDGSYSFNQSYMNGQTGQRWSKFYTSWNGQWSYSGNPPGAAYRAKPVRQPAGTPQTVRPTEMSQVWIKNPFYRPDQQ